jgi:hypothetical protein
MGQKWRPDVQTFQTNANFAANEWHLVKFAADDDIDLCGAGELPLGVLSDEVGESNTDVKYVDVQVGGVIKVEAGATVTGGTLVMSNAAGEAIPVTTGNYALGQAIQGGADGELISVLWSVSYYEEG